MLEILCLSLICLVSTWPLMIFLKEFNRDMERLSHWLDKQIEKQKQSRK